MSKTIDEIFETVRGKKIRSILWEESEWIIPEFLDNARNWIYGKTNYSKNKHQNFAHVSLLKNFVFVENFTDVFLREI